MDLDSKEIKDHVKRRKKEKHGRFIGLQMLDGTKVFGLLEESRPNLLLIKDLETGQVKDVHRALIRRFMLVVDGGTNGKHGEHGRARGNPKPTKK